MPSLQIVQSNQKNAPACMAQKMRVLAWPRESVNPYTPLLYSDMDPGTIVDGFSPKRLLHKYAVWHVHWPESLLNIRNASGATIKLAGLFAIIDYLRWRGTKIIWTVHNFKAHEALYPSQEEKFWRKFIPRVDGVISLSETGLSVVRTTFPRLLEVPAAVIPHGHYRDSYSPCTLDAREALGIPADARVILFFGAIRAYKNVPALLRAFREVATQETILYIVGRPNTQKLTQELLREASADSRVRVVFEFVERDNVSKFMQAADLVVLPYRAILNSGSALLALSFNRPVLVPDMGAMCDLRSDFGDNWVRTFTGEVDARTLEQALDWASRARPSSCSMPGKYNWQSIRSETIRFYKQVVAGRE
jgi:beta-1,4-mannosyltransferase